MYQTLGEEYSFFTDILGKNDFAKNKFGMILYFLLS